MLGVTNAELSAKAVVVVAVLSSHSIKATKAVSVVAQEARLSDSVGGRSFRIADELVCG
jgi:hypothetical protein